MEVDFQSRGGGIESLEDHIKLDMHKTKRIKFPSSNGQPGDLGQKKKTQIK